MSRGRDELSQARIRPCRACGRSCVVSKSNREPSRVHSREWQHLGGLIKPSLVASPLPLCPQLGQHHSEPALPHPRQPVLCHPGGPGRVAHQLPLRAGHGECPPWSCWVHSRPPSHPLLPRTSPGVAPSPAGFSSEFRPRDSQAMFPLGETGKMTGMSGFPAQHQSR